jgi:hypothetical protein
MNTTKKMTAGEQKDQMRAKIANWTLEQLLDAKDAVRRRHIGGGDLEDTINANIVLDEAIAKLKA